MKATEFSIGPILVLFLILAVLAIAIYTAVGEPSIAERGLSALEQRNFDSQKADQLKQLEGYYSTFSKTDGGLDSYEASYLIAKVIEFTWVDCNGSCRDNGDIPEFTRFFEGHPIILSKQLDCNADYVYEKGTDPNYEISKNSIRGICSPAETGVDKTKTVDEWTVTAWGLKSTLCRNFIVDGKQWGNAWCLGDGGVNNGCSSFCAKAGFGDWGREITSDRIKDWIGGDLSFGKIYGDIKVTYIPDCTWLKGKVSYIPVLGGVLNLVYGLKQACSTVEIGEGTANPTVPVYSSSTSCYYGATCPTQNPPVNPPYESQCPAFSSYDGGNGATICLYGAKCCGSEPYCSGSLSGIAQPTPSGCTQEKCWYKNKQICTGGKVCNANGCV